MPQSQQHYHFLDFCRGIAALVVVVYHLGSTVGGTQYFGSGFLAVDFFFILSGFVIAHAYEKRLVTTMGFGEFLRARIIRLYPMAALGIGLGYLALLVTFWLNPDTPQNAADLHATLGANLLLLPKFWSATDPATELFPLDGAIWSLFFELVLNVLFALSIARMRNWTVAALMIVGGLVTLGMALHVGTFNLGWNWQTFVGGFSRALFGFGAGVLIARNRHRLTFTMPGAGWIVLAALVAIPIAALDNLYVSALAIFVVFPLAMMLGINVRWNRLIGLQKLSGNLSYPLYTMHLPILAIGAALYHHFIPEFSADLLQPVITALVLAAAWLAFTSVDVPIRRWLNRPKPQSALEDFRTSSMSRK
jgi:peptidoglycan/LPS O-acetylase OafA/YrhL